jgi:hypothetical protein
MLFHLHLCILEYNIRFYGLSVLSDNFADTEVQVLDVFMNIFFIFKDHEDIIYKDK